MQTASYSFPFPPAKLTQLLHNIRKANCHSEKLDLFPNTSKETNKESIIPLKLKPFIQYNNLFTGNGNLSCLENSFVTH